ncbi:hypothetical protein G210_1345 [Candida maltosa Xu316]|uniref:Uncharacterized protein n=1 Tax=Candida maltosa (strain Xu316) TaxID=1245528 RepID=M3J7V6_CANMX|nr:hypothetical protein G210_1345 [Candida maltosa Xu316]
MSDFKAHKPSRDPRNQVIGLYQRSNTITSPRLATISLSRFVTRTKPPPK